MVGKFIMTKALIFDTGTLINLSMNGLLYILPALKEKTKVRFVITHSVKYEVVDRPMNVPRFELGALRVRNMIDSGVIELPQTFSIAHDQITSKTNELMELANHSVKSKGKWIKIVSDAEISCLALSNFLSEKRIDNIIAIDERTTRILSEKPQNLEKTMSKKLRQRVTIDPKNFKAFKQFRFIRSTELVYVAHKKGILKVKGPKALEAALFATKFKGSSVSYDEIKALKKL